MYFTNVGLTKDTSALIELQAKRDSKQSTDNNEKSLWSLLSKIFTPSLEVSEALQIVAFAALLSVLRVSLRWFSTFFCVRPFLAKSTGHIRCGFGVLKKDIAEQLCHHATSTSLKAHEAYFNKYDR
ncbi:hypothetical protein RND71_009524 [Anisodus tanguticus]|uniref:Uncharacterized protein n=1 Tax=Anisodus tanguticus TaxID=243964 RepID=A0AAE1SG00_9SOLA|nr:hypothetical protein RND71_009524 [Anisodus tanguticus]